MTHDRNLSRRLSTNVVEALKSHGHILVVKGGAIALGRELEELIGKQLVEIQPRLGPRAPLGSEPTSTFGDEAVDDAVEDMVDDLTQALMDSDHVEDVFAEDNVIRRDIFRVVRDGLLEPLVTEGGDDDEPRHVVVRLDTLGYVAATVSKRADEATLRDAFERAAAIAEARLISYDPATREGTFRIEDDGADERLELEEAVADELADLVEQGEVELPTLGRQVLLPREVTAAEQRAAKARIEAVAEVTLLRTGCAATWEFAGPSVVHVTFTPLSEHDARDIDHHTAAFARQLAAIFGPARADEGPEVEKAPRSSKSGPASSKAGPASSKPKSSKTAKVEEPARAEETPEGEPPSKRRGAATKEKEPAKKPTKAKAPAAAKEDDEVDSSKEGAKAPSSTKKPAKKATSPAARAKKG